MSGLHISTSTRRYVHPGVGAVPHEPIRDVPVRILVRTGDDVTPAVTTHPPSVARLAVHAAAVFAVVLLMGLSLFAIAPIIGGYRPVIVGSDSMAPSLRTADIVVTDPDAVLSVGSVINFQTADGGRIHRIIQVDGDQYRTKGDANPTPDSTLVDAAQVRGVGVFVVPFIGVLRVWLDDGRWLHLGGAVALLAAATICARRRWAFGTTDEHFTRLTTAS